jgi:hypothetical protein
MVAGSRKRRTIALLVIVAVSLLGACRDEDLDYLTIAPTPAPTAVTIHPDASFFLQQMTSVSSFQSLRASLPFEPVLPTYTPGPMQVVAVVATTASEERAGQPPTASFALSGPTGSLTLSEWPPSGEVTAGRSVRIGRSSGRLAESTNGALLLSWTGCDLAFSLGTNPFPPGDPITEDELVRVAESILAACE